MLQRARNSVFRGVSEKQERDAVCDEAESRIWSDAVAVESIPEQNLIDAQVVAGRIADHRHHTDKRRKSGRHPVHRRMEIAAAINVIAVSGFVGTCPGRPPLRMSTSSAHR